MLRGISSIFILSTLFHLCSSSTCDEASEDSSSARWLNKGGFLLLFVGVIAMFWGLAVVCEEYFVPALNILCEELNVPDDVAGATFMAAGASSPELFTSFIALFVQRSAIGVGTVIGSEIFNHMIICAGSVLYSETGVLHLEKRIFTRDCVAYLFSLLVLIYSLKGFVVRAVPHSFDESEKDKCLSVTIGHATALLVLYIVYAIVAGNYQWLLSKFCPIPGMEGDVHARSFSGAGVEMDGGDVKNAMQSDVEDCAVGQLSSKDKPAADLRESSMSVYGRPTVVRDTYSRPSTSRPSQMHRATFTVDADAPLYQWRSSHVAHDPTKPFMDFETTYAEEQPVSIIHTTLGAPISVWDSLGRMCGLLGDMEDLLQLEVSSNELSGYLYEESPSGWSRRFFTVGLCGFYSKKGRTNADQGPHIEIIDLHDVKSVEIADVEKRMLAVTLLTGPPLIFHALSIESLNHFQERLKRAVDEAAGRSDEQRKIFSQQAKDVLHGQGQHMAIAAANEDMLGDHHHSSIIDEPKVEPGNPWSHFFLAWHYLVLPLKYMFFYTLPEMHVEENRNRYKFCLLSSIVWLGTLSFVMITCCDGIGAVIGASPITIGLTLSAVGTSFPNMWSSMLVARQGLGDMAVSNAFGSNTFNICIALGLPWFCLILIRGGESYDKMQDDGIVLMILILIIVLVLYYLLIVAHNWQIQSWMAYIFVAVYIAVIVIAIANG